MTSMKNKCFDQKLLVVTRLADSRKRVLVMAALLVALLGVGVLAASINFVLKWGGPGADDGEFWAIGVATDTTGKVFVVDVYNHRMQKFDANGNFITKWGSF